MATQIAQAPTSLPLYRMGIETFMRLVEAGALDGVEVELLNGLLIDKHPHREGEIHRLDVGTFERMVATGALEGERVELLEGLLVAVSPQSPAHATVIRRLMRHLATSQGWLDVQMPLAVPWGSLPEPDLALMEQLPPSDHHPRTALLAVEVAVSTHDKDREFKAGMYARAGVPIYWIVDVPGKAIEVRTDPGPEGYGHCKIYEQGTSVPSPDPGVPDLDITVLLRGT
jgi:Uma2 family endonuclease